MNKTLKLASLATALCLVLPLAAQADGGRHDDRRDHRVEVRDDHRDNRHERRDDRRDNRYERRDDRRDNRYERRDDRRDFRHDRRAEYRGDYHYKTYHNAPYARYYNHPVRTYRPGVRHWDYWQPRVAAYHYYGFGTPVYYGDHYRVYAYDRDDRLVWLWISAVTGAIIFSGY